ncbi:uncharacterized protein LOC123966094 [Micropterus dolomieu]|uniref:uncharacterized protein LOC123966094 n=1 Tax=Micropterus dolomieu TaxID=147949 RepID=UPI001E8D6AD7|nr:uncharacterized protein LOC123966094 [Micropterus dolomieu]
MMNFTLMTAFILCSLSWISVSVSESQTVEVQSGEEVTLLCSNSSRDPTTTEWFRLINRTKPSCISSMFQSDGEASFCHGFKNGRFEMSANISTVFLKIKQVDFSDTGLYFCGIYTGKHTVIASATHLSVNEEPDGITNLMSVILAGLAVFLTIVVIVLAVKIRKLTAVNEEPHPEGNKNLDSDDLNYTALSFQPKAKINRRPASEREVETNVVYAATR